MRRLGLVAAALMLAIPTAISFARPMPPGDGTLVIKGGRGTIILQVKGAVIGKMGNGKLTLTDNDPYDENSPFVRGRLQRKTELTDQTTVYKGQYIRYRMVEGSYRLKFEGSGIQLSAVGRGWVTFDGDDRYDTDGVYSLNGEEFQPIPQDQTEHIKLNVNPVKPQRQPRRINQP
jgi:hypothetical protein